MASATTPIGIPRQGRRSPGFRRHPGSIWLDGHRAQLPPNEWVAVNGAGVVVHDPSQDGLMTQLQDRHIELGDVVIAYNSADAL